VSSVHCAQARIEHECISLQDEVTRLRQYLSSQPGPSTTDPISLPPALVSVLLPHINCNKDNDTNGGGGTTVTTALTQRVRLLQEENDELYELLKFSETGKLKEEVRGLRRMVERLEGALRGIYAQVLSHSHNLLCVLYLGF
jgi:hypothetical protein